MDDPIDQFAAVLAQFVIHLASGSLSVRPAVSGLSDSEESDPRDGRRSGRCVPQNYSTRPPGFQFRTLFSFSECSPIPEYTKPAARIFFGEYRLRPSKITGAFILCFM